MNKTHPLAGVYAAVVTPIKYDLTMDVKSVPPFLDFLARRGCHGALLLGTTGEGNSLSVSERLSIMRAAVVIREDFPEFCLLVGTGTPSLDTSIYLTKTAFEIGFQGVVTLPPYYYRDASEAGILRWFSLLIDNAVPDEGFMLGYHIPKVSGVKISLNVLKQLRERFPDKFVGIKDSSGDVDHTAEVVREMGPEFAVLVGNDRIFSQALQVGAAGCITALANIYSQELRQVWDAHKNGGTDEKMQDRLRRYRLVLEEYSAPPFIKALLHHENNLIPRWNVIPPMEVLSKDGEQEAALKMTHAAIQ